MLSFAFLRRIKNENTVKEKEKMLDAKKVKFEIHGDERGSLVVLDPFSLPFRIARVFYMFGTTPEAHRGCHAHKIENEFLVCTSGSCKILLDDGHQKEVILLDRPDEGLYVPCNLWREMFDFSNDAVLMAVADQPYDENDYIRNYQEFREYYRI